MASKSCRIWIMEGEGISCSTRDRKEKIQILLYDNAKKLDM
jgi:hypothetical protein